VNVDVAKHTVIRGGTEWTLPIFNSASHHGLSTLWASKAHSCGWARLPPHANYTSLGITVEHVMTDNGACCKSLAFQKACKRLGLRHIRTKPYTPKTSGKAERFIQTSPRERAYAQAYNTSKECAAELPRWLHQLPRDMFLAPPPVTAYEKQDRVGMGRRAWPPHSLDHALYTDTAHLLFKRQDKRT
jgi:hypothetical protein